ncbi:MAG: GTP 3',8-cyclase MoaA [Planctomycetes bacterium]|nr:GTP 3',8-cyclase MoaA [Planctomycetota bacterium]
MDVPLSILNTNTPPVAPADALQHGKLFDSHGRQIRDLRLSVTDRCNFRCVYCMAPDVKYIPKMQLLTLDEYIRVIQIALSLGIEKLRITGGEPTLYPHLDELLKEVGKMGLKDIALTTNGSRIRGQWAQRWKSLGLNRVTVSLDTLNPQRKDAITRSQTSLQTVINSIDALRDAGLTPVKVNAVIMRGVNDDEVVAFADFAKEHEVDMRMIEFMPLDAGKRWERRHVVSAHEMLEQIKTKHDVIRENDSITSTSMNYRFKEGNGRIGFIASVTQAFCGACDRMRIMADGTLRPCLFSDEEWNIRSLLRSGASDDALRTFLINTMWQKSDGHQMNQEGFQRPQKTMSRIGG